MTRSNLEIIHDLYGISPVDDLETFLAALAPDVEWRFADSFIYADVNPVIGREAAREASLGKLRTEWDGFRANLEELIDGGDTIVGLGRYTATHKGTGRRLDAQFAHIFDLKDGLVRRWRQYVDTRQFAEVAGVSRSGSP